MILSLASLAVPYPTSSIAPHFSSISGTKQCPATSACVGARIPAGIPNGNIRWGVLKFDQDQAHLGAPRLVSEG